MGRKIPAKKHRGVKDPLVQQAKRLESLKGKINAPPKDPDEQPVPKSLTRLFAFQNRNNRKSISKKKSRSPRLSDNKEGSISGPNPISRLRKLPGESGRGFSLRINSAVKALHNPAENLDYPLDIEAEDVKGERMAELRERRARKRRRAGHAVGQGAGQGAGHGAGQGAGHGAGHAAGQGVGHAAGRAGEQQPRLTKTQKLALKKKAKKIKATEANKERQEVFYERVSFGDVTHAPPTLHFKTKGNTEASRPGRRALLLSSLLAGAGAGGAGGPGGAGGLAGGAGRGAAGGAAAEERERARQAAVAAYRALKASKIKTNKLN